VRVEPAQETDALQIRRHIQRMMELTDAQELRTWRSVSRDAVDPTNDTTERIIGLDYKIRARTTRGFKS
jgi:hypothetical protein